MRRKVTPARSTGTSRRHRGKACSMTSRHSRSGSAAFTRWSDGSRNLQSRASPAPTCRRPAWTDGRRRWRRRRIVDLDEDRPLPGQGANRPDRLYRRVSSTSTGRWRSRCTPPSCWGMRHGNGTPTPRPRNGASWRSSCGRMGRLCQAGRNVRIRSLAHGKGQSKRGGGRLALGLVLRNWPFATFHLQRRCQRGAQSPRIR